jgi:hypothetical protein
VSDDPKRPILLILTSHWISMLGVTLVTLAGVSWLLALPANARGHVENPYIGILVFLVIPAIFFAGLALIPLGIYLGKRKMLSDISTLSNTQLAWRRAGIFFVVMTVVNVIIGSQGTYRAIAHMETPQFCGESCHVMKPEFTGHLSGSHTEVACASCHIETGAAGWVKAKASGTRQLMAVMFNSFPRPIESAMESNRLASSRETCEQCHARDKLIGSRLKVISKFKDDEANTRSETVLMMLVGGGRNGGIHGAHMGPGVQIRYGAADKKRETIPWVEYRNTETKVTRSYSAGSGVKPDALTIFEMQCVDCHNRAAHTFSLEDQAIDAAMARGELSSELPFIKKTAVDLLNANYATDEEASQKIPAGVDAYYQKQYPAIAAQRRGDVQAAGKALLGIYQRNVFPDLKVTWGTYPNHLGHTDNAGCFRCHDDGHTTSDKKSITNDCSVCHQALAVEETSPEILKTLGIADRVKQFGK